MGKMAEVSAKLDEAARKEEHSMKVIRFVSESEYFAQWLHYKNFAHRDNFSEKAQEISTLKLEIEGVKKFVLSLLRSEKNISSFSIWNIWNSI